MPSDDDPETLALTASRTRPLCRPDPGSTSLAEGVVLASRYRIAAFAGRGGMAEVYRADDLTLGQPVALKLLPAEEGRDEARLARLVNEVRTARRVAHPNVCRVYDIGEAEGRRFFSMEWIEGENLDVLMARVGRLPRQEALRVARQICAGLAAAHDRGVIHRDLKPSNIMIDDRGVVRIADFGVAEAAAAVRGLRAREGTPEYMAPEQLAGEEATPQSDLYALGLVLHEIFTGKPAHSATTAAELSGFHGAPPRAPSTVAPDLEPAVDRIILRCLARDPADRPASAREVAAALPADEVISAALAAAQQRADRIAAFRQELADLRESGLLHVSEQDLAAVQRHHERVLRDLVLRFDVDIGERGKQFSLGMRVASLVGAIALAGSVFYFFLGVWGSLSVGTQAAVLVAATLASLLATAAVSYRETTGYFSTIAASIALACFILEIAILSGTVGVSSSVAWPLAWGVFAMILAYGYALRLMLVTGLALLSLALAGTLQMAGGRNWDGCMERPESFLAAGALLLGVAVSGTPGHPERFRPVYRCLGTMLLLAPPAIVGQLGLLSYLPVDSSVAATLHQILGFLLSAGLVAIGIVRGWRETVYTATAFFFLLLFLRFHDWWWDWMPRYLFFFMVGITAVAALVVLRRLRAAMTTVARESPA